MAHTKIGPKTITGYGTRKEMLKVFIQTVLDVFRDLIAMRRTTTTTETANRLQHAIIPSEMMTAIFKLLEVPLPRMRGISPSCGLEKHLDLPWRLRSHVQNCIGIEHPTIHTNSCLLIEIDMLPMFVRVHRMIPGIGIDVMIAGIKAQQK